MAEDDKELFASAFKDEVIDTPEVVEAPEPVQPRDEHGRFAPKAQEQDEPVIDESQQQEPVQQQPEPKPQGGVPSFRLKEEADARRAAEERATRLEQEMEALKRQVSTIAQPKKADEPPPPEPWDPGYTEYVQQKALEGVARQHEAISRRFAIKEYGQENVQAACTALEQALATGDPAAKAEFDRLRGSEDPYEGIVQWHKRQQVFSTVGNDPNAWLEQQLEERLKDPAYQAQLLERIRGTAQQSQRPVTQLPPSLNKMTRAGSHPDDEDESEAGLLKSALRR